MNLHFFRNMPIRRKLTVAIVGTATIALLVACVTFVAYELVTFREAMAGKLSILADVLGTNSTAALQFQNPEDATEILRALAAEPEIDSACLYTAEGIYFAGFARDPRTPAFPAHPGADGARFGNDRLLLFRPVMLDSRRIGTIYICASLNALSVRIQSYVWISALVLGGSLLIAVGLGSGIQRLISVPILSLAGTAKQISEKKDYSLRARKVNRDELGFLTDSFNQMVADVEERTLALEQANNSMESEIAERRRAEETIREQAALLDKAQDSIFLEELDGGIHYWNQSAVRLYGWSVDEVRSRKAAELLFDSRKPEPPQARATTIKNGEWIGEMTQITRDNVEVIVESRWTLISDSRGAPKSILYVNSNITERKKLEAQFFRAQRLDSIGRLAGGIAHDLNNLLSPVLMGVSLLKEEVTSETGKSFLDIIQTSAQRGADILKHVLTFARGVGGDRTHIQVRHLIKEMGDFIRETFPRNILFSSHVAPDLHVIQGDATQIHQIFMNLCVNSRDAMPNGGTLLIEANNHTLDPNHPATASGLRAGAYISIKIVDSGSGIPPGSMDKIFDPFFTTKDVGKGTGLGLSVVFGIVKTHGGLITVDSAPGKGTSIEILLPALKDAQATESVKPPATQSGSGELILIVDDEPAICQLSATILRTKGYQIITAQDGADAIEIFKERQAEISLVLTDVMMPRLDGVELTRALKAIQPNLKVIASTGQAEESRQKELCALGVTGFLRKPYNAQQLQASLQEALRRK